MGRRFDIEWLDAGREPHCPPDPDYPNGKDIDAAVGARRACEVLLKYPAKRCGAYTIECRLCRLRTAVTTTGRPDDPRSVRLPCKIKGKA